MSALGPCMTQVTAWYRLLFLHILINKSLSHKQYQSLSAEKNWMGKTAFLALEQQATATTVEILYRILTLFLRTAFWNFPPLIYNSWKLIGGQLVLCDQRGGLCSVNPLWAICGIVKLLVEAMLKCGKCEQNCMKSQHSLKCNLCEQWLHKDCIEGMTKEYYENVVKMNELLGT